MNSSFTERTKMTLVKMCGLLAALAVVAGLIAADPSPAGAAPGKSAKAGAKRSDAAKRKAGNARHRLRIINGMAASTQEFPWAVFIRFNVGGETFRCTGSVIKPRFVLTAAHCAISNGRVLDAGAYTVIVGRDDVNDASTGRAIGVVKVTPHPDYYARNAAAGNDLAVLELAEPVNQTPATMVAPGYYSSTAPAAAVGWGRTEQGTSSDALKAAVLWLYQDGICLASGAYGTEFDGRIMLCAGTLDGSADTCFGDSGGPLMVLDEARNWKLVGVTSFGPPGRCAVPNVPGVYTYLGNAAFQRWIAAVTTPTTTAPAGNGGGVAPVDSTVPIIQTLAMPSRFRAARRGASMAMRIGATIRYRLSEAAIVRFTVRRAGGRPARSVRREMVHSGRHGANRFAFTGRWGAGSCHLVVTCSLRGPRMRPATAL